LKAPLWKVLELLDAPKALADAIKNFELYYNLVVFGFHFFGENMQGNIIDIQG
jgi:hypothetical protein